MVLRKVNIVVIVVGLVALGSFLGIYRNSGPSGYSTSRYSDNQYTKLTYESTHHGMFDMIGNKNSLLILSSIVGREAYGKDRTFPDFLSTIQSLHTQDHQVSLGLLVSSDSEFDRVEKYLGSLTDFNRITLIKAPFLEYQVDPSQDRHADKVQRLRRKTIARARNFLLFSALRDEKYTLFVDADIERLEDPSQVLKRFIESNHDIIVPRIVKGNDKDYDKNSWRGSRTKPNEDQLQKLDNNQWDDLDYTPRDTPRQMFHFETFLKDKKTYSQYYDNITYSVKLDSVGGAVLFAKSSIYKQGIIFPTSYIVGTTWERLEGYDGIETEGLCYLAKGLGYECWGMPNMIAYHGDR